MRMFSKPENFEQEPWAYLSVGYYNGKIILKDEWGELYYLEEEEEAAPVGTALDHAEMTRPVDELEEAERMQIVEIYG